jgi:hypothetical protein
VSRNRAIIAALLLFAALFAITAALQYLFIRHEIRETVGDQLDNWADNLRTILDRDNVLDLAALRRAAPEASAFIIMASDGTFIATHGFVRGIVSYATLPPGLIYDKPIVLTSSLGEEWHLFARRIQGGSVIVGASNTDCPPDINARLVDTSKGFGNSLESAIAPSFREKDENVDFAVLADDGVLLDDYGGIPLKAKRKALLLRGDDSTITIEGTPLFFRQVPILDRHKRQTGTIVVVKEVALEQEMLHESLLFNIGVAVVCVILSAVVLFLDFRNPAVS